MTAQSLSITSWVIPPNGDAQRLNQTLGYEFPPPFIQPSVIRTLSTNGGGPGPQAGLFYVPTLPEGDPCIEESEPYVPANVTRYPDLQSQYRVIAFAPWTSGDCAMKYMRAARTDPPMGYVQGFVFFTPNTPSEPLAENDPAWDVDGARRWRRDNGYPIYAISSNDGDMLMNASADYSGNLTNVPNGSTLEELYSTQDYVRLYAVVGTGSGTNLPSLWVFLLIVLGILLLIIGITSLTMHVIQRRRRNSLRRRVAAGEVDLEALGIKRLTVPQELLQKMPLYTYGTVGRIAGQGNGSITKGALVEETSARTAQSPATTTDSVGYHPSPLSQPTCPICLEDFEVASSESQGTTVRELPCHHIFHPECVDVFLRDNSSLCPMCKETVLPKGYCPTLITNAMVRRERMVRNMRQRAARDVEMSNLDGHTSAPTSRFAFMRPRRPTSLPWDPRMNREPASAFAAPTTMATAATAATAAPTATAPAATTAPAPTPAAPLSPAATATPPPAQPRSATSRQEWARQRALSMVGRDNAPVDPDAEEARRTPKWKKALRTVFGGR